jgi:hypothetical protein
MSSDEEQVNTSITSVLSTLLDELLDGSNEDSGWALNPKDPGLIRSIANLSAADASVIPEGGSSSIAAHVDHLRYGLNLLTRWSQGESPFADADWSQSWQRTTVSQPEWAALRADLKAEARRWQGVVRHPREYTEDELTGYFASAVHLAYHLGAIRQINATARGPRDATKA